MKRFFQVLITFLMVIVSFRYFEARFIGDRFVNYSVYIFMIISIAIPLRYLFAKRGLFVLPVQMIVIGMMLTIVMAQVSWGQSYGDTIIVLIPYMVWIFFFYLLHARVPVKTIEKITLFYGGLYVLLYAYQLMHPGTIFFGRTMNGDEFTEDRGIARIIFPGGGIFVLAAFMALNKFTTDKKRRLLWGAIALVGIIVPVLQVTRAFIAAVLLIYLLHFLQKQNIYKKLIVFVVFAGAVIYVANSDIGVIKGIKEASKNDADAGSKNIRVQAATFFLTKFPPNTLSRIFGNGPPYHGVSYYGKTIEHINDRGYFLEDVGVVAVYTMFGILPIIALLLIWYKSLTVKIPEQYRYAKYYLWYLLFTCLTTDNIYHPNYLISTVFALYIYQAVCEEKLIVQTILARLAIAGKLNEAEELAKQGSIGIAK